MEENQKQIISKVECQRYLKTLLEKIKSKEPDELSKVLMEYLHFLAINYENLDPEMQQITDKIMETSIDNVGSALKEAPDTSEVRKGKRLYRNLKKNLPSAKSLIMSMESPIAMKGKFIKDTKVFFEKYCQVLIDALYDIMDSSFKGIPSFAMKHLLINSRKLPN
jgi:hypothetical protein